MRHFTALLSFVFLLSSSIAAAVATSSVPQSVTTAELQRYIYQPNYPTWCGAAGMAAREMRVKPTTDPKVLHGIMKANITECANTSYAQRHTAIWTTAVFGAAAAALLAARHETGAAAIQDATHAKSWAEDLVKFTHTPGPGSGGRSQNTPSMYRTNANRIHTDAVALLAALKESSPNSTPPDALPAHVQGPSGSATPHP